MDRFPIPLNALRAIEIVARTGALKPAADELGVTIGAVSQHIRRAEARLGVELFDRTTQGLRPTAELEAVRAQLTGGFTMLLDATRAVQRSDDQVLTVTMGSVFAACWLIKRLPQFAAAHPELEFRLLATGKTVDLARTDVDCAIRFGEGRWPDVAVTPLQCRAFRPVAAPAVATVNATGVVSGVSAGTATISAAASGRKGSASVVYRTAFGKLDLPCPRLYARCRCGARAYASDSFNPLAMILAQRTYPELLYLQTRGPATCSTGAPPGCWETFFLSARLRVPRLHMGARTALRETWL